MGIEKRNWNIFGRTLRQCRQKQNLTQKRQGEHVGVVRSFICALENGKKQPSLDMVFRLAAALGVRPGELVDAAGEKATGDKVTAPNPVDVPAFLNE